MSAGDSPETRGDPRPQVARPRDWIPLPLVGLVVAVLALALFLQLEARRHAATNPQAKGAQQLAQLPPAPPALDIPPPPPPPPPQEAPAPPPAASAPAARAPILAPPPIYRTPPPDAGLYLPAPRSRATLVESGAPGGGKAAPMVFDQTLGPGAAVNGASGATAAGAQAGAGDEPARATLIRNRASVIPQGAIIAAVLETPLNSDRPGLARAVISQDARGFDGSRVLIPKGSRLIGEFKADNAPGLRRVLITWTRLIRPDGAAIRIDSPVSDALGQAGVGGRVNTHFLERFSGAVLQSALTIGVNLASTRSNSNGSNLYIALPGQAAQVSQQLTPDLNRPPTVTVREGAEIAVVVARDLDFSGAPPLR